MKKDLTEVFITVSAWAVYLYLVVTKIANVEGFVALTVYIVKKALDMREQNGGEDEKSTIISSADVNGKSSTGAGS